LNHAEFLEGIMVEVESMEGFVRGSFTDGGKTRDTYTIGSGPGVVVIHEIPGITPHVSAFGRRVADRGMTAVLPVLFGTPGKPESTGYTVAQFAHVCISREFAAFAKRRSSPVTVWLRALCRDVHRRCGGPGVGVIGMCATGGFALALMADPSVMAPVLSQPSLPLPITAAHRAALGVSPQDLAAAKARCQQGITILGLRFTADRISPPERFATLRAEFGAGFEGIEIDSSPGNRFHIPPNAHSVVTVDLVDEAGHPTLEALERVLTIFQLRLHGTGPGLATR
jgi:dienelactone hydrolase